MKITDIKQDRGLLKELITSAGYEVSGHSNDAVIGRIMMIVGIQYLERVIQATHLNILTEDKDTTAIFEAAKELGRVEVLEQMMAADKWDGGLYKQFSINSEGVHFSEIGPYSEKAIWAGYKSPVETLAFLDAHREVV